MIYTLWYVFVACISTDLLCIWEYICHVNRYKQNCSISLPWVLGPLMFINILFMFYWPSTHPISKMLNSRALNVECKPTQWYWFAFLSITCTFQCIIPFTMLWSHHCYLFIHLVKDFLVASRCWWLQTELL